MIAIEKLTDAEFEDLAFDLLRREPGADGLARFLRLHRCGPGDYTVDRTDWLKDLAVDDVASSIQTRRTRLT